MSPGPTIIPTDTVSLVNSTEEPYKGYAVITSPYPKTNTNLPMVPEEVPLEMTTAAATAEVSLEMTTAAATDEVSLEMTTAAASKLPLEVATDATKEVAQNDTLVTSQQTERPKSWQPLNTQAAAAKTEAPTKEAEVVQTSGTAAATTESDDLLGEERARHACTGSKQRVTADNHQQSLE